MGAPWFKIRHLEWEAGLIARSANFALYGDMSSRMMEIAATLGCGQEIYSIDECFLDLTGIPGATARARDIQARIRQWIGIPTCIGIAPTKTLAKLANHIAKSADRKPGSYPAQLAHVCNLCEMTERQLQWLFARTAVGEVWGVGPRIGRQLEEGGVSTVEALRRLDPGTVRKRFSVVLERTVRELNGVSCIDMEHAPAPKQEIACTRSFGTQVSSKGALREALTEFASRAARKLRGQGSATNAVHVFIRTSPFRPNDPQYASSSTVPLPRPSSDTLRLVSAALTGLDRIYKPDYPYAKAGVMLLDLQPAGIPQGELDFGDEVFESDTRKRLMGTLDAINDRYGRGALKLASAHIVKDSAVRAGVRQFRAKKRDFR